MGLLLAQAPFEDAVRFVAHALPKREAVWWAWVCARRGSGESPAAKIGAALQATEKWIAQPNEDNCRAAMEGGSAALAALLSGGSLAPPNAPVGAPGEHMTAKAGAVLLA